MILTYLYKSSLKSLLNNIIYLFSNNCINGVLSFKRNSNEKPLYNEQFHISTINPKDFINDYH